jgi:hypothetical protein
LNRLASRPKRPVRELSGAELEQYCRTAAALIRAGRLSRSFPDPERCAAYLLALAPSTRGEHAPMASLDLASGLPSLKDLVAVEADAKLAAGHLAELDRRPGRPLEPAARAKADYYRRLDGRALGPLWSLNVTLRRVDGERGCAAFEVVFDRYDPAETVFARYTVMLEQQDALWGSLIDRRGDYSEQTSAFRDKIERFTQDDSELAFLLLGQVEGLRVEEVVRGRVGPLWSPWAPPPPEFAGAAPGYVLHLPLDRASQALGSDRNDDPFSTLYRRFLSEESRLLVEEQAAKLGYRVHKDRKFVATAGPAAEALRARLAHAGTRNIVYEA